MVLTVIIDANYSFIMIGVNNYSSQSYCSIFLNPVFFTKPQQGRLDTFQPASIPGDKNGNKCPRYN